MRQRKSLAIRLMRIDELEKRNASGCWEFDLPKGLCSTLQIYRLTGGSLQLLHLAQNRSQLAFSSPEFEGIAARETDRLDLQPFDPLRDINLDAQFGKK
jgi:hypothetical protein